MAGVTGIRERPRHRGVAGTQPGACGPRRVHPNRPAGTVVARAGWPGTDEIAPAGIGGGLDRARRRPFAAMTGRAEAPTRAP